ncbi:MAG TPA: hypothetical protein VGH27_17315 [Streptosporangiaceae bacterium]
MNSGLRALLAAGGAVALTLALSTPPASATAIDSSYTAVPGGVTFDLAVLPRLLDAKTGTGITCDSSKMAVTLPGNGIPHAGSGFGVVNQLGFTTCTIGGVDFTVTSNHVPWSLNISSFNTVQDVVHGSIAGIDITLSGSNGCSAE